MKRDSAGIAPDALFRFQLAPGKSAERTGKIPQGLAMGFHRPRLYLWSHEISLSPEEAL
jgi:hypothetical protein